MFSENKFLDTDSIKSLFTEENSNNVFKTILTILLALIITWLIVSQFRI